jgi:cysteine desulfurase / selenocysteine lyase
MPIEPIINQAGWDTDELNSGRLHQLADSLFHREEFNAGAANHIPDDLNLESVFEVLKSVANKEKVLPFSVEPVDDALAFDLSLFTGGLPQTRFNFAPDKQANADQTLANGSKAGFVPSTFSNYAFGRDQQIRYADSDYLDVNAIRRDFSILHQKVNGKDLVWFDNAATTQKPKQVIDGIARFYEQDNSNIHRAAHTLAARSTDAYEKAREKVRNFIGASSAEEIIFVRGTTEGINLVTQTYGWKFIQPGDEIIVSTLDHHANIVPWQQLAKEKGARLIPIPINNNGDVLLEDYEKLLGPRTKFVSVGQVNNTFGTISPVKQMI